MTMKPLVVRAARWQGRTLRILAWAECLLVGTLLYFSLIQAMISLFDFLKRGTFADLPDATGRSVAWLVALMLVLEVVRRVYRPYLIDVERG